MQTRHVLALWYTLASIVAICWSLPVLDASSGIDNGTIEELQNSFNDTPKNLSMGNTSISTSVCNKMSLQL